MLAALRPAPAALAAPLLSEPTAPPSFLGAEPLSARQRYYDERLRTLSLVVLASFAAGLAAYFLREILERFLRALAMYYLLMPLIEALRCRNRVSRKARLPRGIATFAALIVSFGGLVVVGAIAVRSIRNFTDHAANYNMHVEDLIDTLGDRCCAALPLPMCINATVTHDTVRQVVSKEVSTLIPALLGSSGSVLENAIYTILILAFLLVGEHATAAAPTSGAVAPAAAKAAAASDEAAATGEPAAAHEHEQLRVALDTQIYAYIRAKLLVGGLVGALDAACFRLVGIPLWLAFGVLAFWLSFVPNVGFAITCCLPLPFVLLDPSFGAGGPWWGLAAVAGPLVVGTIAKDCVEPKVLGENTSLTPVAVLLGIMFWGTIWGMTGMVLAVPLTAVLRLYLQSVDHPIAQRVAQMLSGQSGHG